MDEKTWFEKTKKMLGCPNPMTDFITMFNFTHPLKKIRIEHNSIFYINI